MDAPKTLDSTWMALVLAGLRRQAQVPLKKGGMLRQIMLSQLAQGKPATGYRAVFLTEGAQDIINAMYLKAAELEKVHPDDCVAVTDMLDMLHIAQNRLLKALAASH